ncbi:MAG: glutamate racemase, partial [Patescibacteria group bacterium]|nr:glutamate racemase [Patescibacteria group bacterium]
IDVKSKACSLFVPMVEEGWHKEPFAEEVAEKYLADIRDWSPDVLFLGCTHYPMLIEVIKKVMGVKIEIIDSASPIAACLRGCVDNNRKNLDHFYFSDLSLHYKNLIRIILGKDVKAEQMDL